MIESMQRYSKADISILHMTKRGIPSRSLLQYHTICSMIIFAKQALTIVTKENSIVLNKIAIFVINEIKKFIK